MSGQPFESTNAVGTRRATIVVLVGVLAVLTVHILTSWGYVGLYWGDSGRWLYEVDRVAHGASIYRDVYWGFPPLGMWLVGGAARLVGSDLAQVWSIMAVIAVLLGIAYALVVTRLLPLQLALPAGVTGMALGAIYASNSSPPLVSGMYSPAVPVAILIAFAQLALFLREWERPSVAGAVAIGALGGAGILTKHDVWFFCALLTIATALVSPGDGRARKQRAFAAVGAFVAVVATGLAVLAAKYGVGELGPIFEGHGQLRELAGVNYPNMSNVVMELAALGLAAVAIGAIAWLSGAWRTRGALFLAGAGAVVAVAALGIWLLKAELFARHALASGPSQFAPPFERMLSPVSSVASERLQRAFMAFRLELMRRLIPIGVPLIALGFAIARRQLVNPRQWRLLVVLLLAVLSLRARRLISYDEWSALMLEVPIYSFAVASLWPLAARVQLRAVTLGCAVLLAGALGAHYRFGFGVGTRRGAFPFVQTERGPARLGPGLSADYRYVHDLALLADPTGRRPMLSFGYSAGHNYLTGRPGVGSLTHGFRMSLYPSPDSAYRVAQAMHDRLILVDNPAYVDANPAPELRPWRWQPRMVKNPYLRDDRPLFEALLQGCRKVTAPDRKSGLSVYDCAPAATAPTAP